MRKWRIGRAVRELRKRQGLTQAELGALAGCSRGMVSRIERDLLDGLAFGPAHRCVSALGGWLRVEVAWQGERLGRLLDERHARLQDRFVLMLEGFGWIVRVEVSFNEYGDRGRIDILAWHPVKQVLMVVEVKPAIGDVQDTLGRLDVKCRIAPRLARSFGWQVRTVVPALVLEEGTSQRRLLKAHTGLFRRYDVGGRAALSWLRHPDSAASGVLLHLTVAPGDRG